MLRDEEGRVWVFIGPGSSDGRDGKGRPRRRVAKGCVVGVRMGWDVNLRLRGVETREEEEEEDGGGENGTDEVWKIAVLWDVLDA